jgi:RimJ/RimL family protein N-acetyltransferase
MPDPRRVELAAVDDDVLVRLVAVAVQDAAAAEVTPPVGAGTGWTSQRVDWLRAYHRDRRPGLDGPLGEATWAVVVDGEVAGAVRLRRTAEPGTAETGIWLARSARGRGAASRALAAVVALGRGGGLAVLRAETTAANGPALAVLRATGFAVSAPDEAGTVVARLTLTGDRG